MTNKKYKVGELLIESNNNYYEILEIITPSKIKTSAKGKDYIVTGNNLEIHLTYTKTKTEIFIFSDVKKSNNSCLNYGLKRLSIIKVEEELYPNNNYEYVILQQANIPRNVNSKPEYKCAAIEQLNNGAGFDIKQKLIDEGAIKVGISERVLGKTDSKKNAYCAVFEENNEIVPVLSFVITRILPLINKHQ